MTPAPPKSEDGGHQGSWWSDHPDLVGVARRGRREYEEEAAEAERDTEQLRRRRRGIVDVCFEWMSRGDLVGIGIGARIFNGRLVAAVNDLVSLETETSRVVINLNSVRFVRSEQVGAFPGTTGERSVSSFRAELGRHEVEARPVRLLGEGDGFDVTGVIEVSAPDHVIVVDGRHAEWLLPLEKVCCVVLDSDRGRQANGAFDSG